jgi:6-phosphogluconate dehydrogenase
MQIGMIGLGRMGANMARRLIRKGHTCVVFNRSPQAVNELIKEKAVGATSLADVVKRLEKPRAIWLMVPAGLSMLPSPIFPRISRLGTSSLTEETLITSMICGVQSNCLPKRSTTSMWEPVEGFGVWSEVTA